MDATEKYTSGEIRKYAVQAVDFIIQQGTENTTDGKWTVHYGDVPKEVCPREVLNLLFEPLARLLANRPEVVDFTAGRDEWAVTYDPAYCVHCPETTPIQKENAIDDELAKKLESVAAYIVEDGATATTSGVYTAYTNNIPADLLPPEMVEQYKEEIESLLFTYDAVADVELDEDDNFDVTYYLGYCPNYEPDREEADEYPEDREIFAPLSREAHDTMLAMLAECRPAAIPEKIVQHPPVYMATLPYARDNDELDAFIESRDLNRACADDIDKAIHDSMYELYHYDMENAAKKLIGNYGMERVKIIVANTVQIKDYDGRFSSANKEWAKGVTLPDVPKDHRFDFFTECHPALLDGFIKRLRQMEQAAEKAPAVKKPSLLGELAKNKQDVAPAKPPAKGKSHDMEV